MAILPDAMVMPLTGQGDVDFARFGLGADVILLIDGVHRQRLLVWHKETLPKPEGDWQETQVSAHLLLGFLTIVFSIHRCYAL